MEATLKLEPRSGSGKGAARKLRRAGRIPGIVYGAGEAPVMVSLEAREAQQVFHSISVENTILHLSLGDSTERALVREVQTHPFRQEILHVDFLRIQRGVPIEVQVPVRLSGVAAGVRVDGGRLDQVTHDIPVKCVPSKIPESIEVDVTPFVVGDVLRAGDLTMPEEVENLADPGLVICGIAAPVVVAEEEDEEAEGVEEAAPAEDEAEAEGES